MKTKMLIISIFLIILTTPSYGAKKNACYDTAGSQVALNECAASDLQKADVELNRVYREILKRYAGDQVFINRLKAAQRAWITFRDAELAAIFPAADPRMEYGSAYPMCYSIWLKELTVQRTDQLRRWLVGVKEGEMCAGSLPVE